MYHFFAEHENIHDSYIDIVGSDVNHIKNVLRFKEGDKLLISSGDNVDYECSIASMSDEYIRADILSKDEQGKELPSRIILFQGLPKADKMELIIQKAVELGAYSVVPVAMKRSVVKLDAKKAKAKVERWNGIALSAAKQSKRSIQPEVTEVMTFKQALEYAGKLDKLLLPYECAEGMEKTRKVIEEIGHGESVGIFIGPEGGFDLLVSGLWTAEPYVVRYRTAEKVSLLRHISYALPELLHGIVPHILTVKQNLPAGTVVEPRYQRKQRALSASG